VDEVSGSFTGTFVGAVFVDNFDVAADLVVSGNMALLGTSSFDGVAQFNANVDIDADLEIQQGRSLRIGNPFPVSAPNPDSPGGSSTPTFQLIGNDVGDSIAWITRFDPNEFGPHLIFGKSRAATINQFDACLDGDSLGGVIWAASDDGDLKTHAASIRARIDGNVTTESIVGAELIFRVAPGVSANDITEAMRIRKNSTLDLFGSEIVSGTMLVLGSSSLADVQVDGDFFHSGSNVGFYTTTPIALQTGVSVDSAGIHAALVALGLITA